MELRIDRQALVPVVQQVVDSLVRWLRCGNVAPGTRLPPVRQIARINLLSQACVVEACERLVVKGLLVARRGTAFFVASPQANQLEDFSWDEGAEGKQLGQRDPWGLGCGGLPESWRETDDLAFAIRQVSRTDMASLFNYSTPLGLPALRQQIIKRLIRLEIQAQEHEVMTTSGASQALDLIVRTLFMPGDSVVVESPGYCVLFDLLRLHRITMIEIPRNPNGPDIAALEAVLLKQRPRALFINSFHQNPTGSSLGRLVAKRLFQLANAYGVLVIEDDVYADLHTGPGVRLAALDAKRNVVYVGSYSKTLSSSLRVGFVVAPAEVISRLVSVKMISSKGASPFAESVLACLLASGAYGKLVQRQRQRINGARRLVLQMLDDADWEVFGKPSGGLFVWARSRKQDRAQIRAHAQRCGIQLSSSTAFSPSDETTDWLRINVAYACDQQARRFFQATSPDRPQAF